MQYRRSAAAALCAVVAMVAAACTGAVAVPRGSGGDEPAAGNGRSASNPPDRPERVPGDGAAPKWELSPPWALHPETLRGSERLQELTRKGRPTPGEPTNIVLITTDDMNADEIRWMPKTRALIGKPGVTFTDSVSPHPLCCPARALTLTGQFAQNNGVRTNTWPTGGHYKLDHSNTLPVWLKGAGYETAFMGKYLNEYGWWHPHEVPPGWDHWRAPVRYGVYDYYNYRLNEDGELRDYRGTYQTDYYTEESEKLIPRMAADDQPFFLWQSHMAPHTSCPTTNTGDECFRTATPGISYNRAFDDVTPPQLRKPSYNERDVSDKPKFLARQDPLEPAERRRFTELFQRRIETLQSVDDSVARTVAALDEAGELDNTLIVFTSDNGFLLGEHRTGGKNLGYEPALQVPLLMRGPSMPAGVRRSATVGTVDLAPTIAAAAGATPGLPVDGRNLLPVAAGTRPGWETLLVQGGARSRKVDGWFYRGVRTQRYTYLEYRRSGELELYDRRRDPFQLHNAAGKPAYARVQAELRRRLLALQDCAGAECRQTFGPAPSPRPRR